MGSLSKLFYYWKLGGVNELATVQKAINGTDNGESYPASTALQYLIAINFTEIEWLMCTVNESVKIQRLICWEVTSSAHLIL